MTSDPQRLVIDYLSSPAAHGGAAVERIDTHSAIVFLAGARALKLKRAVRFDYLDFSTAPLRRAACEAEVEINRRTAPSLYRGVAAVTRDDDGTFAIGGSGAPVEWLVEMARFDQEDLFDRLAARGALDLALMEPLAAAIARLHQSAERRPGRGGRAGITWVVDGNARGFAEQGSGILDDRLCAELTAASHTAIAATGDLLDRRRADGFVRQCHGDLHLRNIVLLDGQPTLFDAVEFNDEIACVDVLYDLAFLLMDLWRRELRRHANVVLGSYLADTGDLGGLAALPLFLSCRAAVRAKTTATAAGLQPEASRRQELEDLARSYLAMAGGLLKSSPARLVAVGGLSGSGKSTLARALAPSIGRVPGALVLRSDEIRKSLAGVPALTALGPESYTTEMTARVYEALRARAGAALAAGQSVVVDAVWAKGSDRAAIEALAGSAAVPFSGIWLDAPADVLLARAASRGPDASDADAAVIRRQLEAPPRDIHWRRLDASRGPDRVLEEATALLASVSSH